MSQELDEAVEALGRGLPVVIPTDTVYGIAVDPAQPGATARLFAAKGRPPTLPSPVLVASLDQARSLAADLDPMALALITRFWPGGLTVVVPRRPGVDLDLGGTDDGTIGLRQPAHPVPVALAERVGPLAVSSANRHGEPTPSTATDVGKAALPVAMVIDGGVCAGAPSTVVACTPTGVRILREGRVPAAEVWATPGVSPA